MEKQAWKWDDLLRIVLLRCLPNCRGNPIQSNAAAERFRNASGFCMKDIVEKLAVLEDIGLVVRGGTQAQLTWIRTKKADDVVTLLRGALCDAKIPPDHWTRIKDIQGRTNERGSIRRGRFCRTLERLVLLSLLERGPLSASHCQNGIEWICGVGKLDVGVLHCLGKEMLEWGLIQHHDGEFELTDFGKEQLEFARHALGLSTITTRRTWDRWPSAFDFLEQSAPVFRRQKAQSQETSDLPLAINSDIAAKDPLRESLRFLLGQDGLSLVARLALVEMPSLSEIEYRDSGDGFLELQKMGLVQQDEEKWLLTASGEQMLLFFRALLVKKNKAYVVGALLGEPGLLRKAGIRVALLVSVKKISSILVLEEGRLLRIVHRILDGLASEAEIREQLLPLLRRQWVKAERLKGLLLEPVGELRLGHLARVLQRGEEETFELRELLPEDLLDLSESPESVAAEESDDEWYELFHQARQTSPVGSLFGDSKKGKEGNSEKADELRRFLDL